VDYAVLPGTDLTMSRLTLGTMTFGAQVNRDDAQAMVTASLDAGITVFDTSNSYNGGESERILGEMLAPIREKVILASKVFYPVGDGVDTGGLDRGSLERALDHSLKRLGTDYLDIYFLHAPDPNSPIAETMDALGETVRKGKVRHVGVSNFASWQIAEICSRSDLLGWPPLQISQTVYNLLARRIEDEYVAMTENFDVFSFVYNPLAGGLLSGARSASRDPEPGTRYAGDTAQAGMYRERYWNDTQFRAVEQLTAIARDAGLSLIELSYRWLFSQPAVGSIIVGASRLEQLAANLRVAADPLEASILAACDHVWSQLEGVAPAYHR
jgi:aryl-alcohol dehydrogenase-like predicted oxidoreductase